jgi:hypothetical protein
MRLSCSLSSRSTVRGAFDTWLRCIIAEAKLELAKRHFAARAATTGADTASHAAAALGTWPDNSPPSPSLGEAWARLALRDLGGAGAGSRVASVARRTAFPRPACERLRCGLVQWRRAARRARRLFAARTAALDRTSMALDSRAVAMALSAWAEAVGMQRIQADERGRDGRHGAAVTDTDAARRTKVSARFNPARGPVVS